MKLKTWYHIPNNIYDLDKERYTVIIDMVALGLIF